MWAAGIVTYVCLFNKCPFADTIPKETYKKIENLDYSFPLEKNVSKASIDFMRKILTLDPLIRLKPEEAINHPFLTDQIPTSLP